MVYDFDANKVYGTTVPPSGQKTVMGPQLRTQKELKSEQFGCVRILTFTFYVTITISATTKACRSSQICMGMTDVSEIPKKNN